MQIDLSTYFDPWSSQPGFYSSPAVDSRRFHECLHALIHAHGYDLNEDDVRIALLSSIDRNQPLFNIELRNKVIEDKLYIFSSVSDYLRFTKAIQ